MLQQLGPSATATPARENMSNRGRQAARIVLVDDDNEFRESLAMHLIDEGFGVTALADGQTALQYLGSDESADIILLDNMDVPSIRKAVELIKGRALIEVSGGVSLATVRKIATAGPDYISVGALTHSAPAANFSMDVVPR